MAERVVRFGLVGTHYWARETHAAALRETPGAELVGVWGRDPAKARALAEDVGATAHEEYDDLLAAVDAVVFSVPPDVQAPLAERAAGAGRHLLLEKPVALDPGAAAALEAAVAEAGVASLVFFTARYAPEVRGWLETLEGSRWEGGTGRWLANAFREGSPFDTPWRREHGGLWDVGPHAVSTLTAALGRVTEVRALRGVRDLVHLALAHEGGASSTLSVCLTAPEAAGGTMLEVWGPSGRTTMPLVQSPAVASAGVALRELAGLVTRGEREHPCDVAFGRYVVDVLAAAQEQLPPRE